MGKTARAVVSTREPRSPSIAKAKTAKAPQSGTRAREDALARADLLGKVARARFEEEIDAALKRRPTNEAKLAGALRALAPLSPQLRGTLAEALQVLLRRRTLDRELYTACVRSLAECKDKAAPNVLKQALTEASASGRGTDAGGIATLSAAASCDDPELAPLLSKIAASRQSHLAFGAEVARVARGESNGAHLLSLAPMIKESHRISLCVELFVPLARGNPAPKAIAKPLYVLGEVATKAGDTGALDEARTRSEDGPASSRAAWSLVAWALQQVSQTGSVPAPAARPTVEIVARLSDRPSADRDMTFLFRLASAKAASAKGMLETLAKSPSGQLTDETAMRAAMHLARDYGRDDLRKELFAIARGQRREDQRGFAAAMLWDVGERDEARDIADELVTSKCLANVVWASLLRASALSSGRSTNGRSTNEEGELLCSEPHVRWIHLGWLE